MACAVGWLPLARLCLQCEADPALEDARGRSSLHLAHAGQHAAVAELLMQHLLQKAGVAQD